MNTKKAGTVLVSLETNKIGLVFREALGDYSFPKGHLEDGETLEMCAIRETVEETGRNCSLIENNPIEILYYTTPRGENVENYMYLVKDEGPSLTFVPEDLKESLVWTDFDDVEKMLTYNDLKEFWNRIKYKVKNINN